MHFSPKSIYQRNALQLNDGEFYKRKESMDPEDLHARSSEPQSDGFSWPCRVLFKPCSTLYGLLVVFSRSYFTMNECEKWLLFQLITCEDSGKRIYPLETARKRRARTRKTANGKKKCQVHQRYIVCSGPSWWMR